MIQVIRYRKRESGESVSIGSLRTLKPTDPRAKLIHLPKDLRNLGAGTLNQLGIDPVWSMEPPEHDPIFEQVLDVGEVQVEDMWFQDLVVANRFENRSEEESYLLSLLAGISREARNKGIVVSGIPIKTDADAQARINLAVSIPRESYDFVVGTESVVLNRDAILLIHQKIGEYLQACYTRESQLITLIKNPEVNLRTLDLRLGWPE